MVKLHIQPFKLHLVCHHVSHICLVIKIFHVWYHVVLIKIHISEWLEMYVVNSMHQNQLAFILNFSLLYKDSILKCLALILILEYSLQIRPNKYKPKSRNMHLVVVGQQNNNNKNMVLTYKLIFLITILDSFYKMINNLKILPIAIRMGKWWQEKSKRSSSKKYKILSANIKKEERQ